MSIPGNAEVRQLVRAHNEWCARRDPLLGPVGDPDVEPGNVVRQGDVLGYWNTATVPRDEPFSLWTAEVTQALYLLSPTPPTAEEIDAVLGAWLACPAPAEAELLVTVPARLTEATLPLASRGFVPLTSTVVRSVNETPEPVASASVEIGPPRDGEREALLGLLEQLHEEELAYAASRPHPRARERYGWYLDAALSRPEWAWVARRDGDPVGLLVLTPPEASQWVAPLLSVGPVAYLGFAITTASARGLGAGSALVAQAMCRARLAGCRVVALDHAALSPISSTFWHRQGFRPLWTRWAKVRFPVA